MTNLETLTYLREARAEVEALEHRLQNHYDNQKHAQIMLDSKLAILKSEIMIARPFVRPWYLDYVIVPLSQTSLNPKS